MKINDALNTLGLQAGASQAEIKAAYRAACRKYHPDINPAGKEMMQAVNEAYASLNGYRGEAVEDEGAADYGDLLNEALNAIMGLNLNIEVCGSWVWVSGNTYPVREQLKEAGFKYASKKKMWYFRPEGSKTNNRRSWSMDKIREKHGSQTVKSEKENRKIS